LSPEEQGALRNYVDFRDYQGPGGSNAEADRVAQNFYTSVRDTEGAYDNLTSPQKMQYQYLRYVNDEISGNNKDDQIKKIWQNDPNLEKEYIDDQGNRSIWRNKPMQDERGNITAGDAFFIGNQNQGDTGKDDGLFQQVINKSLPGFDVGDITSFPGVDIIASLAAPYTGGASIAVLEGLKAAEAGKIGVDNVLKTVAAMGGWDAVLDQLPSGMGDGFEIPEWARDAYEAGKDVYEDVAQNPLIQQAQDIYGQIRDFTDPIEDIFGNVTDIFNEFDTGGLEEFLPGATAMFAMPQRDPIELLPLEYNKVSGSPVNFLNNPFEESII
jgi:hypothetical protein